MNADKQIRWMAVILAIIYVVWVFALVMALIPGTFLFGIAFAIISFGITPYLVLVTFVFIPLFIIGLKAIYDLTKFKKWARKYLIIINICWLLIMCPFMFMTFIFAIFSDYRGAFLLISFPLFVSYLCIFLITVLLLVNDKIKERFS